MSPSTLKISLLLLSTLLLSSCGINNIPTYDEAVDAGWANVQNQYQRRAELIPNLVETVKGFAAQEKEVLTEVTEARARVSEINLSPDMLSDPAALQMFEQNQSALGSALSRLLAVAEAYPDLKSNENFLALQQQLEGTENRIAVARSDYIKAVQRYNTELRTIPGRWWHALLYSELEEKATFEATPGSEETPEVNFNN